MTIGNKLGLFWGNNFLSVIESQQDSPVKTFRIPCQVPVIPDAQALAPAIEESNLVATIYETFKANKVSLKDIHLALPSKDIVIRSFIIPFLKPNEIKGVVEFEIKKHIPFNLKDLAYSFHAFSVTEDKIKRMRVHFVAIRKSILEHYISVLKQAGFNVVFSEPAPMCLARVLLAKKLIKPEQKIAIIQTDFHDSRIIVVDNGVVQFVRDFQLQNPSAGAPVADDELLKKKMFNEIKISLDFYMRQFKSEKINEVLTISFDQVQEDFTTQMQQELEIPVRKVDPHAIANFSSVADVGVVNAYGAVLQLSGKPVMFNLSGPVVVANKQFDLLNFVPEEYIPALKVGVICAVLIICVLFLTKFSVSQMKKKCDLVLDQQGVFLDMTVDSIQAKTKEFQDKLNLNKNIFRKTEIADYLVHLAKILPEGIWLENLSIQYNEISNLNKAPGAVSLPTDPSGNSSSFDLALEIGGFAYSSDSNRQFKVVYNLVNTLKADETFKTRMKSINLSSIQSVEKEDKTVTSFTISGK